MSAGFLSIFVDSASGVSRIVLTVIIGAVGSWGVKDSQLCFKDFGFIITNVLVPSLFFTHMLEAVNLTLLISSSILIFFSVLSVILGYVLSIFATRFIFPDSGFVLSSLPVEAARTYVENVKGEDNTSGENLRVVIEYDPEVIGQYLALPPGVTRWDNPRAIKEIQEVILSTVQPPRDVNDALRPNGYRCMLVIGSMIQNTFVLPLSLVESLRGSSESFDWIDLQETTAFIFFFNIVITVMFWTAGPLVVKAAGKEHHRRVFAISTVKQYIKLRRCTSMSVDTSDIGAPSASTTTAPSTTLTPKTTPPPPPHYWDTLGGNNWLVARCKSADRKKSHHGDDADDDDSSVLQKLLSSSQYRTNLLKAMSPMLNLPIVSLFAGLVLGLIPWTRWLFMEGPFTTIREPLSLLGDGTVPAALLLLGANLTSNFSSVNEDEAAMRHFSHGPTEDVSALNHHRQLASEVVQDRKHRERPPQFALPVPDEELAALDAKLEYRDEMTDATNPSGPSPTTCLPPKTPKLVAYSSIDDTLVPDDTEIIETWAASFADADKSLADEMDTANGAVEKVPPAAPGRSLLSLFDTTGIDTRLLIAMCGIRLLIMPGILFALVHLTVQSKAVESVSDPQRNVLLLTLLIETSAPSAINTALLFSIYQFMTAEYSKCLLYQYTASMVTMVMWLTAIIAYTS